MLFVGVCCGCVLAWTWAFSEEGGDQAWPHSGEWPAWGEGVGTWLCPRKFMANLEGKWGVTTVGTNL